MSDLPVQQSVLNKARKDKFLFILTIPNILKDINAKIIRDDKHLNLDTMQFSLFGANIPGATIPEISVPFGGQNYNVTSYNRPAYPPCTVNFTVDNEFKNYWVIWKWLQLFNDQNIGTYASTKMFPEGPPKLQPEVVYNYQTNISILGKDEYNNDKIEFIFKYCFPNKLGDINYSYRDPEEMECSFTFVFNQLDINLK